MATPATIADPTDSPATDPALETQTPEPNAPGEIGSWEADIASLSDAPAPKAPAPPPAKPAATPPAKPPTSAPAAKPATPPTKPGDQPAKPPAEGRKSKLDPDELLSVDGVDQVELPADVVESLQKLDARDLRVQSAKIAKLARGLQAKLKQNETELVEARKTKDDPEKKLLVEERQSLQKRIEEAENHLRYLDFRKSQEYQEKFQKPFQKVLSRAYSTVKEFEIKMPDETTRPATQADFDRLVELPRGEARKIAREQFGEDAPEIIRYLSELTEIRQNAFEAEEEYKKTGSELEKKKAAEQVETRSKQRQIWEQSNKNVVVKFPEFFGKDETDSDANEILAKGYKQVDRAFDESLSVEERISLQAANRHRAAAFSREVYRRKKAQARIAELEAELEEFRKSIPGPGAKDGGAPPEIDPEEDANAAIDAMARPA